MLSVRKLSNLTVTLKWYVTTFSIKNVVSLYYSLSHQSRKENGCQTSQKGILFIQFYKLHKIHAFSLKRTSLVCSEESSDISDGLVDIPQRPSNFTGGGHTDANSMFKSARLITQGINDDIDSYSSEDDTSTPVATSTRGSIIDYKNQFATSSAGRVSRELLMGDNDAFILARKKKWMNAKKGKTMGKKWRKFKGKGKGKK